MEKLCPNCFEKIDIRQPICPNCQYDTEKDRDHYLNALPNGTVLNGRYLIGRVLGQGGFGITYLAKDYKKHALCAIKEYLPQSFAARTGHLTVAAHNINQKEDFEKGKVSFLREAQTLSEFGHNPHIVTVHRYFEENGTAYFVMDYIRGVDLSTYLDHHGGSLSWNETWGLLRPMLIALNTVHLKGIIHRDLKPENIFVTEEGLTVLLDFGSARYTTGEASRSLSVILTPGYAPYEQYSGRGRQGPFTDVYGLAATMYRMLTGRKPPESVDRIVEDDLLPPEQLGVDLPPGVSRAILHALAVKAKDRTKTARAFREEIEQKIFQEDMGQDIGTAAAVTIVENPLPKKRKGKFLLIIVAVFLMVCGGFVAAALLSCDSSPEILNLDLVSGLDSEERTAANGSKVYRISNDYFYFDLSAEDDGGTWGIKYKDDEKNKIYIFCNTVYEKTDGKGLAAMIVATDGAYEKNDDYDFTLLGTSDDSESGVRLNDRIYYYMLFPKDREAQYDSGDVDQKAAYEKVVKNLKLRFKEEPKAFGVN